jgi:Uma2 family endonuclease
MGSLPHLPSSLDAELRLLPPRTEIMPMAVTARRFTVDEVLSWPDDGNRYELVDGVLIVTPAPVPVHQVVAYRFAVAIGQRVPRDANLYVANPGEILIRPHLKMEPDVLVFRTPSLRRKWEEIHEHWLAVEVFSPSSRIQDREVKRSAYLQVGVNEVWLVDPEERAVFVSRQDGTVDQRFDRMLPWQLPSGQAVDPIPLVEIFP